MPEREAFHIGPFHIGSLIIDIPVYWYGIVIMLGVVVASYLAYREAKRRSEDPENVWQMFPWVLVAGIVGARLGWVLSELDHIKSLGDVIAIRSGGLSIQGSVIGGGLAVIIYCRQNHLSFFKWADIIVPGVALAQAIGRWGNFFNQEAFGSKTTLPWGIPISVQRQREVGGPDFPVDPNARFHPTFAYEMVWDLLNFGLLMWLGRQKRFKLLQGDLLWAYLIVYSIGRMIIEQIRVDSATVGGFKTPQLVALLTIVFALVMIAIRHRPGSNVPLAEVNLPEGAHAQAAGRVSRVRRVPAFAPRGSDAERDATVAQTES